ncbi:putative bifunctional diguanylate cyclase/phosphodiesterase [Brevibacillus centrosporus]|uniref:putative bifunctional diguanylate cyclase/phosphodiesterase n=1 Tax=Brevibacillus centrosporus TaxID=54910 RepID=UPI003B023546
MPKKLKTSNVSFLNYSYAGNTIGSHSRQLAELSEMKNDLQKALQNNEFTLHYQPQIDLRTLDIIGIEALIRWNHPVRGQVPPIRFIPLAEKTGLIVPIGKWVLGEACHQAKSWQLAGCRPIRVAVNLSACQFLEDDFVNVVKTILFESGLSPENVEFEITESMNLDAQKAISKLKEIKELGIFISIDDFGTGYNSFRYLKDFTVDKLKIDKSFLSVDQSANKTIVSSIISMAHQLGIKVIGEGVETEEQLAFLQKANCDEAQGFLICKPLPPHEIEKFIQKHEKNQRYPFFYNDKGKSIEKW